MATLLEADSVMDMTGVSLRWLEAREAFHEGAFHGSGDDVTVAYCLADEQLLAAFSCDWRPDDPTLFAYAYQSFRHNLIEQHEAQRQSTTIPINLNDLVLS